VKLIQTRRTRGRPRHPDVLTPVEWRVLEGLRRRAINAEIARMNGVSVNTIRTHVSSILSKTGLPDRRALATWEGRMSESTASHAALRCSFCGKTDAEVERLLGGAGRVYICEQCVEACNRILAEHRAAG
jgi:DNA-binding CsgD family transcriptional regulator